MRKQGIIVAVLAVVAVAIAGAASMSNAATSAPASGQALLSETQVRQDALSFAAANGDPSPTSIEHVEGPGEQLIPALSGESATSSDDVDVIVMQGDFPGVTPSTGGVGSTGATGDTAGATGATGASVQDPTVMIMVIDATTGQLTQFGLGYRVPDLAALGSVTQDQ